MEVMAKTRFVRLANSKAVDMARALQGLPVPQALQIVSFSERKAAYYLGKTLKSAIANAENNPPHLAADSLVVKEAVVGTGPTFKRWKASARGMAAPRLRRTCHVKIVVAEAGKRAPKAVSAAKPAVKAETKPAEAPKSEQK